MGKAERNRRNRRTRHGRQFARTQRGSALQPWWTIQPAQVADGGTAAARKLAARFSTVQPAPCHATFTDDPVFAGGFPAGVAEEGHGIDGRAHQAPPVLLFEPKQLMAMKDTLTDTVHEVVTESLVSAGLQRLGGPHWSLRVVDGWGLYRCDDQLVLRDADGVVMAKGHCTPDPGWTMAAARHGYVRVLHGYPLGVRVPRGKTPQTYTVRDRAAEFRSARDDGLLVGGIVRWGGDLTETLDWTLFPPGAFGLPLPLAYVPLWHFTPFGGPEEFGFVRLNQPRPAPIAHGLVAAVTETDLDLVRPEETERALALVAGYQSGQDSDDRAFFRTWQEQVLSGGGLLVLTGSRPMPAVLGADPEQDRCARDAMADSWAAEVRLSEECFPELRTLSAKPPAEPPPEVIIRLEEQAEYVEMLKAKVASQDSYTVNVAKTLTELIDKEAIQRWITNLWPLTCQTCGDPIGAKADVSADGPTAEGKVILSLHHSGCRPSGITPPEGITMRCPTSSYAAGCLGRGGNLEPHPTDIPVMVINPSCEQLQLLPDGGGGWRNATLEGFADLGFAQPDREPPPAVQEAEAEIKGDYLIVTVTGHLPDQSDHQWAVKAPSHVIDQVRRMDGLAVALCTKALPTLLAPEDLPSAFADPEALVGFVRLVQPNDSPNLR